MRLQGSARMIRVYFGEDDRWQGQPLYEAIVQQAHARGLAGATVYRGIEGYGASTRIHRPHLFGRSRDLPIVVTLVDEPAKVEAFLPVLEAMVTEGLIAMSDVEVIRYVPGAADVSAAVSDAGDAAGAGAGAGAGTGTADGARRAPGTPGDDAEPRDDSSESGTASSDRAATR